MREDLFCQLAPFALVKCFVETEYTSTPFEAIACHL